jgi:hypothetical protein
MLDDEIDVVLPERRNTRRRREPRLACDCERANAIEDRTRRRERGEARLHVTGDEIVHGRAGAAERHMHELDAGFGLKELRREVGGTSDSARGDGDFFRLGLRERDEVLRCLGLHRRIDEKNHRGGADQADRREVADGIVMYPLLDRRNDGVRHVGEQEGVAVRRGFGSNLDAEAAAGAGTVVDDDLLAERFRHPLADEASEHIRAAAGRIGHDEGDGTIGIGFGRSRSAGESREGGERKRCRQCHSFCAQHRYPVHDRFHAFKAAVVAVGSHAIHSDAGTTRVDRPQRLHAPLADTDIPIMQIDRRIAVSGDEPDPFAERQGPRARTNLEFTVLVRDAGHFDVGAIMHPRGTAFGAVGLEARVHDCSVGCRHADDRCEHK